MAGYDETIKQHAYTLRRAGCTTREIADELKVPRNTISVWMRDLVLTTAEWSLIQQRELELYGPSKAATMEANRQQRRDALAAIDAQIDAFIADLKPSLALYQLIAAMLYLGEGAKADGSLQFANANPQLITYWIRLIRACFNTQPDKWSLSIGGRFDQNPAELEQYWRKVTAIERCMKTTLDQRNTRQPTKQSSYQGVCNVVYYDVAIQRYLEALSAEIMTHAIKDRWIEQHSV